MQAGSSTYVGSVCLVCVIAFEWDNSLLEDEGNEVGGRSVRSRISVISSLGLYLVVKAWVLRCRSEI